MKRAPLLAVIITISFSSLGQGLFHPFYFRTGAVAGVSFSRAEGSHSFSGLRTEYGLSSRWSVVGDLRTGAQGSIAARWFPFQLKNVQPYLSVGFGAGTSQQGTSFCHQPHPMMPPPMMTQNDGTTIPMERRTRPLMLINAGVSFKISKHWVGHAEAYAQRYMQRHGLVSAGVQAGISYQFGK